MKLAAIVVFLLGIFSNIHIQSSSNPSKTWVGEIDGVNTWITVLARDRDFTQEQLTSEDWNDWGNTETDAYFFAFDNPENVRLILTFDIDNELGTPVAKVYLNDFGRLPLAYEVRNADLKVFSNDGFPYLTISPKSGNWWVDEKPNYDLELLVDGMYTTGIFADEFKTDGIINWVIKIGSNSSGVPEWETMELINDPRPSWGYTRFDARVRFQSKNLVSDQHQGIFSDFPYFNIAKKGQNYYTDHVFPLYFDLRTYELQIYKFVGGQDGGIWSVNSISNPPNIDFEAPFVFYNFDQSNNYADLVIRSEYSPGGSNSFYLREYDLPTNKIRYSWKTNSSLDWHYGIHTVGLKTILEIVHVGDYLLKSISADNLPGWVVDNGWSLIHFIEAVEGYPGSEGIYFYGGGNAEIWPWVTGSRDATPGYMDKPFLPATSDLTYLSGESIPLGFRAEFTWGVDVKPVLYISSIDRRVHLLNARGGNWNLTENQIMRYENRSGDAYIDTWLLQDVLEWSDDEYMRLPLESRVNQAFYHLGDHLLFSSDEEVIIINQPIANEILRIKPPTDQATWEAFRATVLPITDPAPSPVDLKSWLEDLPGPRVHISGASISEVNHLDGGITIILEVASTHQVTGDLEGPWSSLSPGKYTVQLRDNQWHIQPFVPPSAQLVNKTLNYHSTSFRVNQPVLISAEVRTSGGANNGHVTIELWAAMEGEPAELVNEQELTLGPAQSVSIKQFWHPQRSGDYQLELRLTGDSAGEPAVLSGNVAIRPAQEAQITRAASLSLPTQPALLIALLVSLALSAVLIAAVIYQGSKNH